MDIEQDHKMNCLARWALGNHSTNQARKAFIEKMRKKHGEKFADDLRNRMLAELGVPKR